MKQTNSAITFLLAQYRAIFTNANAKMMIALATAASASLGSTLVEAAEPAPGTTFNPKPVFETQLKDSVLGKGEDLVQSGSDAIVPAAPVGRPIVIDGGKLEVTDQATSYLMLNNDVVLKNGAISLKGKAAAYDAAKDKVIPGLVGGPKDVPGFSETPLTSSLTVDGGTVTVNNSYARMKDVTLAGGTTTVGGYIDRKQVDEKIGMGAYSHISAAEGTLTVADKAVVNLKPASGLNGKLVRINGGTINFEGEGAPHPNSEEEKYKSGAFVSAGDLENSGIVSINGGVINAKANKQGLIYGETINMNGGTVNVDAGANLVLGKTADFVGGNESHINLAGGTINNKGILELGGNTTLADGVLKNEAGATVSLGQVATGTPRTLTLSSKSLKSLLTGSVSGTTIGYNAYYDLHLTDTAEVDLGAEGFVKQTGERNDNIKADKVSVKLSGNSARYHQSKFNDKTYYDFNNLSVGKDGQFTIDGDPIVVVHNGLTVFKDGKPTSTLTIANGSLTLEGSGAVDVDTINLNGPNKNKAEDAVLIVTNGNRDIKNLTVGASTTNLYKSKLNILGTFTINSDSGNVNAVDSTIHLDGASSNIDFSGVGAQPAVVLSEHSKVFLNKDKVLKNDGKTLDDTKYKKKSIVDVDGTSSIVINGLTLQKADFKKLVEDTGYNGMFEGVKLSDMGKVEGKHDIKDLMANLGSGYEKTQAQVDAAQGIDGNYAVGSLVLSGAGDEIVLKQRSAVTLQNASAGNGKNYFVSTANGELGGVKIDDDGFLNLEGTGTIGSLKTKNAQSGTVTIGNADNKANVTVNGSIGEVGTNIKNIVISNNSEATVKKGVNTEYLQLRDKSSLTSTEGAITATSLTMEENTSIKAKGQDIVLGQDNQQGYSKILGNIEAKGLTLKSNDKYDIAGDAKVKVETFTGNDGGVYNVGRDPSEEFPSGGTATIITDVLNLNSGSLFIDPDFGKPAALVLAQNLNDAPKAIPTSAGTLTGKVIVGKNAALGIGVKSEQELYDILRESHALDASGRFSENGTSNAVVLNKAITIDDKQVIVLDKTYADFQVVLNQDQNHVKVSEHSALVVTDKAYKVDQGKKTGAAITFTSLNGKAGQNPNVVVDGDIILAGDFDAEDKNLEIFAAKIGNSTPKVGGTHRVVRSSNGLLLGDIGDDGKVKELKIDEKKAATLFRNVASPVRDLLIGAKRGDFKLNKGDGKDFIHMEAGADGMKADAYAHAATYAGAQQAALATLDTMNEAIAGRVGIKTSEMGNMAATNTHDNGGVWVAPMYKSVESDGFNAQGGTYGADVDFGGVAIGADMAVDKMRFGALFNIGSGDSDGKGNGKGLKDKFDYYGLGVYSSMDYGDIAVVADASYNVTRHEISGSDMNTVKTDSKALSLGVTGQYLFSTSVVDLTPHLGMRFTRLDTDSYDLTQGKSKLASTDFDAQNILSIPAGVTVSKNFAVGDWSIAPNADLTLTFNAGDTEAKSSTYFTGTKNIGLSTEVLDEVTYNLSLGVGVKNGSFGGNVGISYAGSKNTDSFGFNAQARYMF